MKFRKVNIESLAHLSKSLLISASFTKVAMSFNQIIADKRSERRTAALLWTAS